MDSTTSHAQKPVIDAQKHWSTPVGMVYGVEIYFISIYGIWYLAQKDRETGTSPVLDGISVEFSHLHWGADIIKHLPSQKNARSTRHRQEVEEPDRTRTPLQKVLFGDSRCLSCAMGNDLTWKVESGKWKDSAHFFPGKSAMEFGGVFDIFRGFLGV